MTVGVMTFSDDTMFRYAAASYLRTWIAQDSGFVIAFERGPTAGALARLLTEYKVIRNFKKKDKNAGDERFQQFVDVLASVKTVHALANALDSVKVVNHINDGIRPHYESAKHKNFISAASKAAWMVFRHPVAIYDSLACDALRSLGHKFSAGNYEGYYNAWTAYYADKKANIEAAARWVTSSDYARRLTDHGATTPQAVEDWVSTDWFQNRICDQRLVWLGSGDNLPTADLAALVSHHELA